MDDAKPPAEAPGLPLQEPPWHPGSQAEGAGPVFLPLQLVHQPSGRTVALTRSEILLGRHSDADVRLPLPDVSRRHCRFVFTEAGWQVVDLNSLNGVYVNGERVHRAPLRHLDLVRIGSLTFEVNLQAGTETVQLAAGHDVLQSIAEALPPPGPGAECNHRKAS